MAVDGFRSEWISVGKHRVLLEAHSGFPDEDHVLISKMVARYLDFNGEDARLVRVAFDHKACVYRVDVASTATNDKNMETIITQLIQLIYGPGNHCRVILVNKGDDLSDTYHHMEHLSVSAGVARNRLGWDD